MKKLKDLISGSSDKGISRSEKGHSSIHFGEKKTKKKKRYGRL